jgi:hypothetical protein
MREVAVLILLVLTVSSFVGMQVVEVTNANFFPGDTLIIYSPNSNKVYTNTSVPLKIVSVVANPTPEVVSITYRLDKNPNVTITNLQKTLRPPGHIDGSEFCAELLLENLAEGSHTLIAYSKDAAGAQMSASVDFYVDKHYTSPLSVLSPKNVTYAAPEVPLAFVCRETNRLDGNFERAIYMLDGIGSNYIYDNLTLTNLPIGNHKIHITVWTDNRQYFSETIYFTVDNQTTTSTSTAPSQTSNQTEVSSQLSNPTILAALSGVIAAVAVASVSLAYFKRKRKQPNK